MKFILATIAAVTALKLAHKQPGGPGGPHGPPPCGVIRDEIDGFFKMVAGEDDIITKDEAMATGASEDDWAMAMTFDGDENGVLDLSEAGAIRDAWMAEMGC